ncbi:MAG: AlpA family phage regulatory protein [Desulfuromonas sp.]|nr:AlpA family phage regulatory protein [Desulfuromonas sp.]
MQNTTNQTARLLRVPQVLEIVPIGKSTLWSYVSQGKFPQPLRLSSRCTVWKESDVQAWLNSLTA